jgi:hypothetical protein
MTCYLCKQTDHTSAHCNNLPQTNPVNTNEQNDYPKSQPNTATDHLIMPSDTPNETTPPSRSQSNEYTTTEPDQNVEINDSTQTIEVNDLNTPLPPPNSSKPENNITRIITQKRLLSETSSSKSPTTPPPHTNTISKKQIQLKKKTKIRIISNFSVWSEEGTNPIENFFASNVNRTIEYSHFVHILENFTNKSINIHTLIEEAHTDISTLINIIEEIRPSISDRTTKIRLTKLANLLFQALPPNPNQ